MTNIDYGFKAKIIKEKQEILQANRDISLSFYSDYAYNNYGEIVKCKYDIETAINLRSYFLETYPKEWQECDRINHAHFERVKRLKNRVKTLLQKGQCLFLTLTFTNETLSSTTAETRKRYVTRFLKSVTSEYVANIDFGAKNGREHYHAIILSDEKIDYKLWCYGAINGQKIRYKNNVQNFDDELKQIATTTKLAKYVAKLTNHAIKETTKRCNIIYSR